MPLFSHVPVVVRCLRRAGLPTRQGDTRSRSLEPRLVLQGLLGSHDRLYRLREVLAAAAEDMLQGL